MNSEKAATVTVYYGGVTTSTVTQSVEFFKSGKYSAAGGKMTGDWSVSEGALTLTGALTYEAATSTLKLSAGGDKFFAAVLSSSEKIALGIEQLRVVLSATLYYGGNTESSTTQPLEFKSDGTYSAAGGRMTGEWSVSEGTLTLTGALTYETATSTLKLSAGTNFFSVVLDSDQKNSLGIA